MNKRQLVQNYILENNIPDDFPNKTLARIIHEKFPDIFKDVENARDCVRLVRGNIGKTKRNYSTVQETVRPNRSWRDAEEWNLNPIDISIQDYEFPHNKPLILSDVHLPYHDFDAVKIAVEHGVKKDIDSIYLNGDILDCYQLSRFSRDPLKVSFSHEREVFFEFVEWLSDVGVPIIFKMGNHEERWNAYILRQTPELYGMKELALKEMLKLDELNIDYVSGRQKCKMGKLLVVHGHEFGESIFSPVNPARGLFLRAKCSVLAGHNHQTSEHHENNLKGDSMACFSTGALCQLTPEYRPFAFTKWNLGFAIVEIDSDKSFYVDNLRITDGKVR